MKSISNRFDVSEKYILTSDNDDLNLVFPLFNKDSISEKEIKNINIFNTIFLFGEHNNLGDFISEDSIFNNDFYRRKTPWIAYKPIFKTSLSYASQKDALYSSNIGCTLKAPLSGFPIIWDYNNNGVPIFLAFGITENSKRFVFFGDSDPIVSFLAPYNAQFLRSLFKIFDYRFFLEIILALISILILLIFKKTVLLFLSFILIFFSIASSELQNKSQTESDINFLSSLPFHNPHYEFNFSSLPSNIVKNGFSTTINSSQKAKIDIHLLESNSRIQLTKSHHKIFFLFPNSSITFDGTNISSKVSPMGQVVETIENSSVTIADARELSVNGANSNRSLIQIDNFLFVGTESPQRNIAVIKAYLNHKFGSSN